MTRKQTKATPSKRTADTQTRAAVKPTPARKTAARKAPQPIISTGYWLLKSEPDVFSWDQLVVKGSAGEEWTGVRNYLARNNMRAMELGDLAFFYHSNIGLEIVGVCEVCALAHPDSSSPEDPRWECVDVRAVMAMPRPVQLVEVKANEKLAKMSLVTSMRLSVQPVTKAEWAEVCWMGGLDLKSISRPNRS